MSLIESVKARRNAFLILVLIVTLVLTTTIVASAATAYGITADYWQVKLGDKVVATVATESEAEALIQRVKDHYLEEGDVVTAVTIDPEMTTEKMTVRAVEDDTALTKEPQKVIDDLIVGDSTERIYTVQDGDTLWDIAIAADTDIASIQSDNPGLDIDNIAPGDEIVFRTVSSSITVTTQQQITSNEAVAYDTIYEDTDELYEGEEEVATAGVNGSRRVTQLVVKKNGVVVGRSELSSVETTAPVTEVIRRGTKVKEEPEQEPAEAAVTTSSYEDDSQTTESASTSYTSDYAVESTSSDIASATLSAAYSQIGVWQDCTSLVSNSLAAAGIYFHGWPQQYAALGSWTSNPVPGDIIIYSTHVAVYAGGGMAVHGGWCGGTTAVGPVSCSASFIGYIHIG